MNYQAIFEALTADERYLRNLDWGQARPGHPEGSIRAHITEVDANAEQFRSRLSEDDYWKLRILVHSHDTFKGEASRGVSIMDPKSHASLAKEFLSSHCQDSDLLAMVQLHDEPYAIWRKSQTSGKADLKRINALFEAITDWRLFSIFIVVDGCTEGKSREPLFWFFEQISDRISSFFTIADMLGEQAV